MATATMSPQVFAIMSALVEEKLGLHYGADTRDIFADKVAGRAAEAGYESLLDYYYYLRYDADAGGELQKLTDALVVGETFFFRELEPLERVLADFIEPAVRAGRRPRLWSAACSTGEEPLSLAMLLDERGLLGKVDIVATDISERALARARAGRASRRSLRSTVKPELVRKWLKVSDDAVVVEPTLRDSIDWRRVNLLDRAACAKLGTFDAIFCRNVLIYFREDTIRIVAENLLGGLKSDGVVCVGVSESLLRSGAPVACEERGGVFLYRKVAAP